MKCNSQLPFTDDSFHQKNPLSDKFSFNPSIKGAASLLFFTKGGASQRLLHELKYKGRKDIGRKLGVLFAERVSELNVDFMVPVPIHKKKERKRGYNQSMEIAQGVSEVLSIPIKEDAIFRKLATDSQTRRSKVQRWHALENVYSEADSSVEGQRILVIDDVITTGATLGMLCDRLTEKGANELYVGAVARGK